VNKVFKFDHKKILKKENQMFLKVDFHVKLCHALMHHSMID